MSEYIYLSRYLKQLNPSRGFMILAVCEYFNFERFMGFYNSNSTWVFEKGLKSQIFLIEVNQEGFY